MDKSAHDGTVRVCRAREGTAQRARPIERLVLVGRIRSLRLALSTSLYPVAADERHAEDDHPDKHFCLPGGTGVI